MAEQMEFTKRFRKKVTEHGGVTAVARLTGISRTTINYWYQGTRFPDANNLLVLCDRLNVSCDYLLGRTEESNYTADEMIRKITDYTGLSNEAVEKIHQSWTAQKDSKGTEWAEYFGLPKSKLSIDCINRIYRKDSSLLSLLEAYFEGTVLKDKPWVSKTITLQNGMKVFQGRIYLSLLREGIDTEIKLLRERNAIIEIDEEEYDGNN